MKNSKFSGVDPRVQVKGPMSESKNGIPDGIKDTKLLSKY